MNRWAKIYNVVVKCEKGKALLCQAPGFIRHGEKRNRHYIYTSRQARRDIKRLGGTGIFYPAHIGDGAWHIS